VHSRFSRQPEPPAAPQPFASQSFKNKFASPRRFAQLRAFGSLFPCCVLITVTCGTSARGITLSNGGRVNGGAVNWLGQTLSQATEAQRRKRNELIGEMATGGRQRLILPTHVEQEFTRIADAVEFLTSHLQTHSPAKPRTLERYKEVLDHCERLVGKKTSNAISGEGKSDCSRKRSDGLT
jgi:hypothetical protein